MLTQELVPTIAPLPSIPADLVERIRAGRCVAFVGAGFSAPAFGTWQSLIEHLAGHLAPEDRDYLNERVRTGHAEAFEEAAEILQQRLKKDRAGRSCSRGYPSAPF